MRKEIRAVIDTNVMISAVIGKSPTLISIYNAFVNCLFTPILSPTLQEELANVIRKPRIRKYFSAREIKRFKELISVDAILVNPSKKLSLCRDPQDNILLETALEADADCIVSGDKDLLELKSVSGIPILKPKQFLEYLKE